MNKKYPLVSCIMPTANRQRFIPDAIRYFLRQDYPGKELIIVDDGHEAIELLLPQNNTIRYIRMDTTGNTIGSKRNIACRNASGEIIVHWDDDDWYAADWISTQVKTLQQSGAMICGLDQLYFYSPEQNKCWMYKYPEHAKPWVGGATMAYYRSLWERYQFRNIQVGEDNDFVWYSGGRVAKTGYVKGFVSLLHDHNTSPKHISDARWHPCSAREVQQLLRDEDPLQQW